MLLEWVAWRYSNCKGPTRGPILSVHLQIDGFLLLYIATESVLVEGRFHDEVAHFCTYSFIVSFPFPFPLLFI